MPLSTLKFFTSTTCFETFPFPEPTDEQREAISVAARELDRLRSNWLNPPEWVREEVLEFPGSVDGPWARYIVDISLREMNPHAEREGYTSTEQSAPSPPAPLPPGARGEGGAQSREARGDGAGQPPGARGEIGAGHSEPRPLGSEDDLESQREASLPHGRGSESKRGSESLRGSESNRGSAGAIGTVRYPRLVPSDEACAKQLARRTLTNLYNERPTWLDWAHKRLDEAVFAAYGWPATLSDDELLARLLELNLARAQAEAGM